MYDLTVFKLNFGKLTLKVYTKGERVLRIEAVVHNIEALRCPRSLPAFPQVVNLLKGMLGRFLEVLACVDISSINCDTWDLLRQPSLVGKTSVPGVDIGRPRVQAVIQAVIALAPQPRGFKIHELASKVRELAHLPEDSYSTSNAAYDLRKLRGKGFVDKVPKSRLYSVTSAGLQAMAALMVIADKVIRPVLSGAGKPRRGKAPRHQSVIDRHYQKLQMEMRALFQTLGVAIA